MYILMFPCCTMCQYGRANKASFEFEREQLTSSHGVGPELWKLLFTHMSKNRRRETAELSVHPGDLPGVHLCPLPHTHTHTLTLNPQPVTLARSTREAQTSAKLMHQAIKLLAAVRKVKVVTRLGFSAVPFIILFIVSPSPDLIHFTACFTHLLLPAPPCCIHEWTIPLWLVRRGVVGKKT